MNFFDIGHPCCDQLTHDHIELHKVTRFMKFTADQVLVFDWITGSRQVKLLKTGPDCLEVG